MRVESSEINRNKGCSSGTAGNPVLTKNIAKPAMSTCNAGRVLIFFISSSVATDLSGNEYLSTREKKRVKYGKILQCNVLWEFRSSSFETVFLQCALNAFLNVYCRCLLYKKY